MCGGDEGAERKPPPCEPPPMWKPPAPAPAPPPPPWKPPPPWDPPPPPRKPPPPPPWKPPPGDPPPRCADAGIGVHASRIAALKVNFQNLDGVISRPPQQPRKTCRRVRG